MAKWNDKKMDLKTIRWALCSPGYDAIKEMYGQAAAGSGVEVEAYFDNIMMGLFDDYKVVPTGSGWIDLKALESAILNELG